MDLSTYLTPTFYNRAKTNTRYFLGCLGIQILMTAFGFKVNRVLQAFLCS